MSFRQEDRQKNNCPGRGLGLAAAAIGIGVGAAMYYFFSKRQENQHGEGSSSAEWRDNTFGYGAENLSDMEADSDGYTTISENETSDTSVHDDDDTSELNSSIGSSNSEWESYSESSESIINPIEIGLDWFDFNSDEAAEWEAFVSSEGIPEEYHRVSRRYAMFNIFPRSSPQIEEEDHMNTLRGQAFRERPWAAEECSICFEVIRREQAMMTLRCTHRFHEACILPWLQEQQTCPNCRKRV